jgi:uncharacterized repeat protein (TIGR01451 family)/LPXTG-motif cell wall-anchored protein
MSRRSLDLVLVALVALTMLTLVPGAVPSARADDAPSLVCPLDGGDGRIVLDIFDQTGGFMLGAPPIEPNSVGPIATPIPAGIYTVSWASFDAHSQHPGQSQTDEVWYLDTGEYQSGVTTDIPEDVDYAQGILGTNFVVGSDQSSVTIRHGGPPDAFNSVYAICAVLDPLTSSIDIEKATNGEDADTPTGAFIPTGDVVEWTYVVTNTGDVALDAIVVTDDQGVDVTCPKDTLAAGEAMACTASGIAAPGQYANVGTVTGTDAAGITVGDSDASHYFGAGPAIDLVKDVDPAIISGGATTEVTWTITVTNIGNVALSDVVVTDALVPACDLAIGDLAIGGTSVSTCTSSLTPDVPTWTFTNVAIATGTGPAGTSVTAQDDATVTPEFVAASATIGDTVWSDDNGNGVQDNGEKGIAGAKVRLTLPDNSVAETTTNSNGLYLFSALDAGTYKVELIVSSIPKPSEGDLMVTTKSSFTVELADAQSYLDADFGVVATLPKTGLDAGAVLGIAIALLLTGGTAVFVTGRRREDGTATA